MASQIKSPLLYGQIDNDWYDPEKALTSNNDRATATLLEYDDTHCSEDYYKFEFTVPAGSTINWIKVYIEGHSNDATIHAYANCTLVVGGALYPGCVAGMDFVGTRDTTQSDTFGGAAMPTAAQVNTEDFGVHITWSEVSGNCTPKIDHVYLEVDYTEPSGARRVMVIS